jgi:GNAT superfamily N-acetyltransferase
MSDHIRIRLARADDVASIAAVHVASWNEAYKEIMTPETLARFDVARRGILWQRALDADVPIWVADEDGLVVGFAMADGDEVMVLYVHPAWWNLGVGRRLLDRAWQQVKAEGFETGHLWTLVDNAAARRFYERRGGVAGGTRKVQVGAQLLDEILYSWRLVSPVGS